MRKLIVILPLLLAATGLSGAGWAGQPDRALLDACTDDGSAGNDAPECAAACDKGHADSCTRFAYGRARNRTESGEFVLPRAELLSELSQACEMGSATACRILLDRSHERAGPPVFIRGDGGAQTLSLTIEAWWPRFDDTEIVRLVERVCELDPTQCSQVSRYHTNRVLLPRNYHLARQLLLSGCERGSGEACFNLSHTYYHRLAVPGRDLDPVLAVRYLRLGCVLFEPRSCLRLANHLEQGLGVDPDPEAAADLRLLTCFRPEPDYCSNLAHLVTDGSEVEMSADDMRQVVESLEND